MKRTSLYQQHLNLGAKMVPFAGYEMPVSYTGIVDEHNAVRNSVGVFDVSHMGEFIIEGKDALALIQYVTSNDASKLFPGRVQYSCMPNENGGIVDDLLVYQMSENKYFLVVNASNIEKDWNWIKSHSAKFDCEMQNLSDDMSLIAVQGPKAKDVLQNLTKADLSVIEYYHFVVDTFAGVADVIISATGYTGAGGFEIYCKNENAPHIWDAIFEAGKPYDIKPAGLGCRDTLRLEMGFCLYGNDINDTTSPLEAGLGWITKFSKDFVSKNIFEGQKANGLQRKLVGIEVLEKAIPRQHYEILDMDENVIGEVTSGTMSPSMNKPLAMGYVDLAHSKIGTPLKVRIRNKDANAIVVKIPFFNNN
ncbi:MAG: glycine cleavage system aminomethyltransferase GcvT [Bacteroidetes bacterium]|nr:glycine cleavage system aminomethyltransferase GcvT [Bacteroidota bacterium]